ncbi:MAG TPA: HAMP domain-containing protein, partial [Pyrinomonadaceae bacterium]|nr:HAMP domain-containing protein [Pyrinomonadaceae bacterium]
MDSEKTPKSKRRTPPYILGAIVLLLLTLLILLQSSNLWKSLIVDSASDTLLLYALSSLNFIAFVIFGFIFFRNLLKLIRERRAFKLGAKIKTRLMIYFFAVSMLPLIAMAVFSYLFMNRALERWFSDIPENVVREAREVQNRAVKDQNAKLNETAQMIAAILQNPTDEDLQKIAERGNLARIEIISSEGQILAAGGKNLSPEQTAELEKTLSFIRQNKLNEPVLSDGKGFDAAVAELSGGQRLIVVPGLLNEENVSQMVDSALREFDDLKEQNIFIRQIGLSTLGLLTFLLIFAASWTAFYVARGITAPIQALAEGADEIARGNLSHRVRVLAEDELELLVASFNQMSARLEANSAELSERRRYIETVLQSLSTGVISFDDENRITTINRAAVQMLRLEETELINSALKNLVGEENRAALETLISRAKRIGQASEQTVLQRENANGNLETAESLPVALTASALPDENGVVLVIEDLSELIAAQRASAWAEVARRMAHEIKNPLTPIQLAAERIAKRFSNFRVQSSEFRIQNSEFRVQNSEVAEAADGARPATLRAGLAKGLKSFARDHLALAGFGLTLLLAGASAVVLVRNVADPLGGWLWAGALLAMLAT